MTENAATGHDPPRWALEAAHVELGNVAEDSDQVRARAWQLANERVTLEQERHDEFDDPDTGGEG